MSTGKFFMGVLAGVAVGALLGVLFAPDKGSVTREKIKTKSKDFADDIESRLDDFLSELNNTVERMNQASTKESATTAQAETDPETAKS